MTAPATRYAGPGGPPRPEPGPESGLEPGLEPGPERGTAPVISLVIPTFNEAGNIAELLAQLARAIPADLPCEVIFVDDSTDDTPRVITENARLGRLPVSVRHRDEPDGWPPPERYPLKWRLFSRLRVPVCSREGHWDSENPEFLPLLRYSLLVGFGANPCRRVRPGLNSGSSERTALGR